MGRLFEEATKQRTLFKAWQRIKSNGRQSIADETREAIEDFDRDSLGKIRQIQRQLRAREFTFDPQHGVTKKKSSGGRRGIVMASVRNRIVERAVLDTLQARSKFVRSVNTQKTSVGGVPNRSVPHGLQLIEEAFGEGQIQFVRSDISGFFDGVPRQSVLAALGDDISDQEFLDLVDSASTVTLENADSLGEDRKVFPTDYDGVAQGSPLSPLFGNILLFDFDKQLNGRGVTCIRFVDDFVIMSNSAAKCRAAFKSANSLLTGMGLECHDPFSSETSGDKAEFGNAHSGGFSFLGYDCAPGLFQPNRKARTNLLSKVDKRLKTGKEAIKKVRERRDSFAARSRYAQTLTVVDSVIRGWGEAFAYGNAPQTLRDLDEKLDDLLLEFRVWYSRQAKAMSSEDKRRTGGVGLLQDIRPKLLADAPIVLKPPASFKKTKRTLLLSTDGSTVGRVNKTDGTRPVGAWATINHVTGATKCGWEPETTNNRMELRAVIEALMQAETNDAIVVSTDSRYVADSVNKRHVVKNNFDLWSKFSDLARDRKVRVNWVKGHAGEEYNEAVDKLARSTAETQLRRLQKKP